MRNRCGLLSRHKYLLAAIVLILVLYNSLPAAKSTLSPRTEQSDNRPRYLHQSTFRANPDYDYEIALSDALQNIERDPNVHPEATDTIWQIILSTKDQRKDDSYDFQTRNLEWNYQVRPINNPSTASTRLIGVAGKRRLGRQLYHQHSRVPSRPRPSLQIIPTLCPTR